MEHIGVIVLASRVGEKGMEEWRALEDSPVSNNTAHTALRYSPLRSRTICFYTKVRRGGALDEAVRRGVKRAGHGVQLVAPASYQALAAQPRQRACRPMRGRCLGAAASMHRQRTFERLKTACAQLVALSAAGSKRRRR